jgi:hypothetical protein
MKVHHTLEKHNFKKKTASKQCRMHFLVLEKMLVIFSSSDMSVFSGFNTSGTKQPACGQFCTPLEMNTNARMTRILFSPVNGHSTLKCNHNFRNL